MSLLLFIKTWVPLAIAIVFGVLGTVSMKLSQGLKNTKPIICLILCYCISFIALTFVMKQIELSVVYGIWSGVGTLLVALIGIIYFNESISLRKLIYLMLIVIGVIGIHLSHGLT